MKQILTMPLGSPEWLATRLGRVTMSGLKALLVNGNSPGGLGTGAITYMDLLLGGRMTDELAKQFQDNTHTK